MKRLCVYCGSSYGSRPEYKEAALSLAKALRERDLGLVYGGGDVGLMGVVAVKAGSVVLDGAPVKAQA